MANKIGLFALLRQVICRGSPLPPAAGAVPAPNGRATTGRDHAPRAAPARRPPQPVCPGASRPCTRSARIQLAKCRQRRNCREWNTQQPVRRPFGSAAIRVQQFDKHFVEFEHVDIGDQYCDYGHEHRHGHDDRPNDRFRRLDLLNYRLRDVHDGRRLRIGGRLRICRWLRQRHGERRRLPSGVASIARMTRSLNP